MRAPQFPKKCLRVLCIALSIVAFEAQAQFADFTGRPIVELIEDLRNQGLRIVYSRDLVPTRLRVTAMPESDDAFTALREILAPHGLDLEQGPQSTWLIVAGAGTAAPSAPTEDGFSLEPPSLETVIVTASRYPIERQSAVSATSFNRHTIETTPALGQDPLRITHRLPGVSSDQLTSRTHVRGGDLDEVLLRLDGVRLYSPYHLKDFQNIFSSINPRIIDSMDVRTGGYGARYGDRMSGVIDMQSVTPTNHRHHELGISLLETSVLSSGRFGEGRGAWVTSLRRGNLDVLSDVGDSDIGTPQYVDFFNKLEFSPTSKITIETSILSLDDKIHLADGNEANASADYDDTYYWIALSQSSDGGFESSYRLSFANLNRTRDGKLERVDSVTASLAETSKFNRSAIAADWSVQPADSVRLSWGIELANMDLRHRMVSDRTLLRPISAPQLGGTNAPPVNASVNLDQTKRAIYMSARYRPIRRLILDGGIRWDEQTLQSDEQLSPRFNLRFDITPATRIRAAWGEFAQSDTLAALALADGQLSLKPVSESEHAIFGLEHMYGTAGLVRVEIYEKDVVDAGAHFENLFERVSLIPELLPDRFLFDASSGKTRGVELSIEGRVKTVDWWANITHARASERLPSGDFRRSWDERRSIKAGGEWGGALWTVTGSVAYRSGWPISGLTYDGTDLVADNLNGSSLPDFASIDARASRAVETRNGDLEWFIEISNLADHPNYCCLDYVLTPGPPGQPATLVTDFDELLGIVPNIGIRWEF